MSDTPKIISGFDQRSDVPREFTWAVEDLYASDADWRADSVKIKGLAARLEAFQNTLGDSAGQLLSFLTLQDEIIVLLDRFLNYAMTKSDEDTKNTVYQGFKDQATGIYVAVSSATAFAEPELLAIPEETLAQFFSEEPGLAVYRRYIGDIRRKKAHILSNAEEKLLAAAGDLAQAPDDVFSLLNNADITFDSVTNIEGTRFPVTQASFIPLMHNSDRSVRKAAFESLYRTYKGLKNTSAALLSAQMKQLRFFAKARGYDSALAAALDNTNVDPAVYYNLIEAVHNSMESMYKYVRLRKKLLQVDELHMYDLYVPVVSEAVRTIPFAEAKADRLS